MPLSSFYIPLWGDHSELITPAEFYDVLENRQFHPHADPAGNIFALISLCRQFEETS